MQLESALLTHLTHAGGSALAVLIVGAFALTLDLFAELLRRLGAASTTVKLVHLTAFLLLCLDVALVVIVAVLNTYVLVVSL
ncbi:MAG: hypothetical protein C4K60_20270 [Ideonella sp. MAG2]|nr:MAG: hypothetical protein C4K60_20270 [Ideonella sp. MAG2]